MQVSFIKPLIQDFENRECEEIPIVLQQSLVPLIGDSGCLHNIALLEAIINCTNLQGLRTPIIQYIVAIQFNSIRHWVVGYTILLCFNIIILMFSVGLRSFSIFIAIPFFLVNILLFVWELVQMKTDVAGYFKDYWNYLDIFRNLSSLAWIILGLCGYSSLYFTWSVTLINLLRGITVFRLFVGTRFYIELIFRSLNDIKYFFLMFAYSTFTFGFLLMISRDEGLSFNSIWGESYDLNFGNYQDSSNGVYFMQYIAYFGATVINVMLMLNLLISILGDSYERFQLEQAIVDIKEKARISMELQSMMFWTNEQSLLKYIRLCNFAFQDEEEQDWEGRIRFIDRKIDKSIKELIESNKLSDTKVIASSKSIEIKIEEGKFPLLESKITSMEGKITSVECKICDISASLDSKMTSMESKISDINTSLEGKMSDISTTLEGKINDVNQKLEIILNIISK